MGILSFAKAMYEMAIAVIPDSQLGWIYADVILVLSTTLTFFHLTLGASRIGFACWLHITACQASISGNGIILNN